MRKGKYMLPISVFSVIVAAVACAKVSSPSGGPKDKTPPAVVSCTPANGVRNFTGNKFTITFNEFVALDKITEKLMVSPPLAKRPQVSIKKKSVVVQFDEKLRDSTTYTFYFGDAIRDLNEGNIIENYQFVFSTGPVIDSLSVSGLVVDSYSLSPSENTVVLLFSDLSDSAFVKELPSYITKTNAGGQFTINNIRSGAYNLFALKDGDNSKNYNIIDEEIAFLDSTILITPLTNYVAPRDTTDTTSVDVKMDFTYTLRMFKPMKNMHYLTSSARDTRYRLSYSLSLPPGDMPFEAVITDAPEGSWFEERTRERDTLVIWLRDSLLYSQPTLTTLVTYPFTDSTGTIISRSDTVIMRYLAPRATPGRKTVPVPYRVSSGIFSGALRPGQRIFFRSETPFRDPDTTLIRLWEVNGQEKKNMPYSFSSDPANSRILEFRSGMVQGKSYLFSADSKAFGSIYGENSDSTGARVSIRNNETFATLLLNIDNFEEPVIIQMLTNQEKPVLEKAALMPGRIDMGLIDKGSYRLRAVYDINGDGRWTTGDYFNKRQPEPVSFNDTELELKENWNVENNWDLSQKNRKLLKPVASPSGSR